MIFDLEQILLDFKEANEAPLLPSFIVYQWHSDWSDLTENCSYKNFPIWRTKHAREAMLRRMRANENAGGGNNSSYNRRNSIDAERSGSSKRSKHSKAGANMSNKLSSISESKNTNKQVLSVLSSNNFDTILNTKRVDSASHSSISKIHPSSPILLKSNFYNDNYYYYYYYYYFYYYFYFDYYL